MHGRAHCGNAYTGRTEAGPEFEPGPTCQLLRRQSHHQMLPSLHQWCRSTPTHTGDLPRRERPRLSGRGPDCWIVSLSSGPISTARDSSIRTTSGLDNTAVTMMCPAAKPARLVLVCSAPPGLRFVCVRPKPASTSGEVMTPRVFTLRVAADKRKPNWFVQAAPKAKTSPA